MNESIKLQDLGTVQSSGGELTIDCTTGKVLQIHCFDEDYREQFESIDKFDMDEWHKHYPFDQQCTGFDILDLCYWRKSDGYKVECDWDFRMQSHWDRIYEQKQILIDEVMMHIKQDIDEEKDKDFGAFGALEQLLDHLPIPDLYHYLPENMTHQNKFKYLIDKEMINYYQNYNDGHQYLQGMICPNCRTPIEIFDEECDHDWIQYDCEKCKSLITIKKKEV